MTKHKIRRVVEAIYSTPWAITEPKFAEILSFLDRRAEGHLTEAEIEAAIGDISASEHNLIEMIGRTAVINIDGTISHRANFLSSFSGGTSTEMLTDAFRTALADEAVASIVFRIDSPGGTVPGVPELAEEIFAARGKKPTTSFVSPMMASAAYWIGSAAEQVVAMPSSEAIGSIGVRLVHVERSKADEKNGMKRTQLAIPEGKGAINDFSPLSDESRAELMSRIETIYSQFANAVAKYRGASRIQVEERFGGGRTFLANEALQRGLIDRVMTWDELLASLAASEQRPTTVAVGVASKPAFYRVSENSMNKLIMEALVRRGLCSIDATEDVAKSALAKFFADQGKVQPIADLEVITALMAAQAEAPKAAVAVTTEQKPIASDGISHQALVAMVSIAPLASDTKFAVLNELSRVQGLTAQQAADRINKAACEANAPVGATIAVTVNEIEKIRTEARDALLLRTWGGSVPNQVFDRRQGVMVDFKPSSGARAFNLSRLSTLARQVAIACGVPSHRIDAMVPADVAQLAMGSYSDGGGFLASDIARNVSGMYANILLDAQNVVLRRAYDDAPVTFTQWTRQGESLPDFKAKNLVTFGDIPDPKAIPENGEFEEVTSTDSKESYKLVNWGEVFSVSWEAIVNDQLTAFTRVPQMQGSAMRRKQNRLVYAILLNNPTMADTGAVFNANAITTAGGHANLTSGAGAPSVSTLNTLTQKMMEQKGADTTNGGILNIMPTYLIGPPALLGTIKELLTSTTNPASSNANVNNIWQGALTPVIEGELGAAAGGSDTAWYLAASTSQIDTIEYAYLAGFETPRLDRMETFNRLGSIFRIYQPFAAKAVDYRGLQKHAGV